MLLNYMNICSSKGFEQVAQGSDGITIPKSVQRVCRCVTWEHGLVVNTVVLVYWLDSMILEVSFNLNYAMIW